jgi:hypothetical protein
MQNAHAANRIPITVELLGQSKESSTTCECVGDASPSSDSRRSGLAE